ncbi:hypothetical protein [Chachezhania sediminis]|nr:hypothetical protein [Chachezhania sediminis]
MSPDLFSQSEAQEFKGLHRSGWRSSGPAPKEWALERVGTDGRAVTAG